MTNRLIKLLSIVLFISQLHPFIAHAQQQVVESTPATTSSPIDPDSIKDNIKERIKQVVESSSPTALGITNSEPKGWVGSVESIANETLTITSETTSRLVSFSPNVVIIKDEEEVDLEDIAIEDSIIAMGIVDENDILEAKRILVLEEAPTKSTKKTLIGTVVETDLIEDSIFLNTSQSLEPIEVFVTRSSIINQDISQSEEIDIVDLNPQDQVLVIYQPDSDNTGAYDLVSLVRTKAQPPSPSPITQTTPNPNSR